MTWNMVSSSFNGHGVWVSGLSLYTALAAVYIGTVLAFELHPFTEIQ